MRLRRTADGMRIPSCCIPSLSDMTTYLGSIFKREALTLHRLFCGTVLLCARLVCRRIAGASRQDLLDIYVLDLLELDLIPQSILYGWLGPPLVQIILFLISYPLSNKFKAQNLHQAHLDLPSHPRLLIHGNLPQFHSCLIPHHL